MVFIMLDKVHMIQANLSGQRCFSAFNQVLFYDLFYCSYLHNFWIKTSRHFAAVGGFGRPNYVVAYKIVGRAACCPV